MVAVHLYQPLSDIYGDRHELVVASPREAVEALDANYPGFRRDFAAQGEFWLVVDGDLRSADEHGPDVAVLPASGAIHFVPKVEGNAFLGVALVGWIFPALAGTLAAQIIGTALVLGVTIGLSMLFRKKVPTTKESDQDKLESYAFSGPENVVTQGAAVPVVYGRCHVGSVVISAGLELGSDLVPYIPPAAPANGSGAASQYPTNYYGVPVPAGGFPPIIAQTVYVSWYDPGSSSGSGSSSGYTKKTLYGPQGYSVAGKTQVTSRVLLNGRYVNQTQIVEYWKGPQIHGTGFSDNPYAAQFYSWDRVTGFSVYSRSKVYDA